MPPVTGLPSSTPRWLAQPVVVNTLPDVVRDDAAATALLDRLSKAAIDGRAALVVDASPSRKLLAVAAEDATPLHAIVRSLAQALSVALTSSPSLRVYARASSLCRTCACVLVDARVGVIVLNDEAQVDEEAQRLLDDAGIRIERYTPTAATATTTTTTTTTATATTTTTTTTTTTPTTTTPTTPPSATKSADTSASAAAKKKLPPTPGSSTPPPVPAPLPSPSRESSTRSNQSAASSKSSSSSSSSSSSPSLSSSSSAVGADAPNWVPDAAADACARCSEAFTLLRRRHHCRRCGNVFCNACSDKKLSLPSLGLGANKVRVCESCYEREVERRAATTKKPAPLPPSKSARTSKRRSSSASTTKKPRSGSNASASPTVQRRANPTLAKFVDKTWFFETISRQQCNEYLTKARLGSFLVRVSSTAKDSFVLSYSSSHDTVAGRIRHTLFTLTDRDTFALTIDNRPREFKNFDDIVRELDLEPIEFDDDEWAVTTAENDDAAFDAELTAPPLPPDLVDAPLPPRAPFDPHAVFAELNGDANDVLLDSKRSERAAARPADFVPVKTSVAYSKLPSAIPGLGGGLRLDDDDDDDGNNKKTSAATSNGANANSSKSSNEDEADSGDKKTTTTTTNGSSDGAAAGDEGESKKE